MRNQIAIRRADNGYVMTMFSTEPHISNKIDQEKLRYTIHSDVESVVCAVEKVLNIVESMLKTD
ncbi:MAG: hypothetical protein ACTSPB_01350 [Candidatus Thorarchaeota archaeon]